MTEITRPSPEEMREIMDRVRRERAAVFAAGIRKAVGAVVGFLRAIATAFAEARRQRAVYEELSRLSDRELRDIGLNRADIPAVVAGTYRRDEAPKPESKTRPAEAPARPEIDGERLAA